MSKKPHLSRAHVAEYVQKQSELLLKQRARVRKEHADGTHDMRVASRRLRVALREAAALMDPVLTQTLREDLASVTRALGNARELDVMELMLEEYLKDAYGPWARAAQHAVHEIRGVRKEAQTGCVEALRVLDTPEFEAGLANAVRLLKASKARGLDEIGAGLVRRCKSFRNTYRDWRESEHPEDLHRARIACKKLRYAMEFYQPAYDDRLIGLIEEVKQAQELLGDWHDAAMLCDALKRIERHAPYREVQGFPLIIEAFQSFGQAKTEEFQSWAKAFFQKARREEAANYFLGN